MATVEKTSKWFFDLEENLLTKEVTNDYTAKVKTLMSKDIPALAREIVAERTEFRYDTVVNIANLLDEKIRAVVKGAMEESGAVLIKRYGFDADKHAAYIQKILGRFENPYLKDDVERVGRQPLRKLSAGDRLIKPLLGTLEYSLPHKNLIQGIAGAMHFRSEDDPQAQELAALIADKGPQAALAQISGLDANSEVVSEAVTAYKAMQ